MIRIHSFLATVFAASAVLFSPLTAAPSTQGTEISFRVLCFEHRNEVTSALIPADSGKRTEVPLYTSGFSNIIKAKFTDGKATLYVEVPTPDGKVGYKVVAEGPLATGTQQAFLLIPSDKDSGPTYRIVAFEDGEKTFPMGATRVINLAPFPVRLNLAGKDMPSIKPGGVGVYPVVKVVNEWNMYTARIQFGVNEGQWVDVATQSWKASERKRDWVITRFDPTTKQPTIRQYQDIPPWRVTALPVIGGQ